MIKLPFEGIDISLPYIAKEDYNIVYNTVIRRNVLAAIYTTESFGELEPDESITDKHIEGDSIIQEVVMGAKTTDCIIQGYNSIYASNSFKDSLHILIELLDSENIDKEALSEPNQFSVPDLSDASNITTAIHLGLSVDGTIRSINKFIDNVVVANNLLLDKNSELKDDSKENYDQSIESIMGTSNNQDEYEALLKINAEILSLINECIMRIRENATDQTIQTCDAVMRSLDLLYAENNVRVIEDRLAIVESFYDAFLARYSIEGILEDGYAVVKKWFLQAIALLKRVSLEILKFVKDGARLFYSVVASTEQKRKFLKTTCKPRDFNINIYTINPNGRVTVDISPDCGGIVEISYKNSDKKYFYIDQSYTKIIAVDDANDIDQVNKYVQYASGIPIQIDIIENILKEWLSNNSFYKCPVIKQFDGINRLWNSVNGNFEIEALYNLLLRERKIADNMNYSSYYLYNLNNFNKLFDDFIEFQEIGTIYASMLGDADEQVSIDFRNDMSAASATVMTKFMEIDSDIIPIIQEASYKDVDKYLSSLDLIKFNNRFESATKKIGDMLDYAAKEYKRYRTDTSNQSSLAYAMALNHFLRYANAQVLINKLAIDLMTNTTLLLGKRLTVISSSQRISNLILDAAIDVAKEVDLP